MTYPKHKDNCGRMLDRGHETILVEIDGSVRVVS